MYPRILLVAFSLALAFSAEADTKRALFIGNSYTAFNDLPEMINLLGNPLNDTLIWEAVTIGGATLNGTHLTNPATLAAIEQGNWDFVVLQEQSQIPSFPDGQVNTDFYPAVTALVEYIHQFNDCGIPLLYMTWGRQMGDADNCDNWPPVCTYEGMQELLTERYLEAADQNSAWCAPVGSVWSDVFTDPDNTVNLYDNDGSHPSLAGSYLAAATFYTAIFGGNSITSTYTAGLPIADANALRSAVWERFMASPELWRKFPLIQASLTITEEDFGYNILASTSSYVDSLVINTGSQEFTLEDGQNSILFLNETTFFEYTAYSSCTEETETFIDTLQINTSVSELDGTMEWLAWNGADGQLWVEVDQPGRVALIRVADLGGRLVAVAKPMGARTPLHWPGVGRQPFIVQLVRTDQGTETRVVPQ